MDTHTFSLKNISSASAVLLVLMLVGWYIWSDTHKRSVEETPLPSTETAATPLPEGSITSPKGEAIVTGEVVPQKVSTPAPALERSFTVAPGFNPTTEARIRAQLSAVVVELKKNPTSFDDWIALGTNRKALGDYEGAKEAWEYVSLLYPGNIISFGNLGDLYANFLHDYAKAETNFLTAIKNKPADSALYMNLMDLYKVYKVESGNVLNLLKTGVSANPDDMSLAILLARTYRDNGFISEAKTAYDKAIALAEKAGNTSVVTSLTEEKNAL